MSLEDSTVDKWHSTTFYINYYYDVVSVPDTLWKIPLHFACFAKLVEKKITRKNLYEKKHFFLYVRVCHFRTLYPKILHFHVFLDCGSKKCNKLKIFFIAILKIANFIFNMSQMKILHPKRSIFTIKFI